MTTFDGLGVRARTVTNLTRHRISAPNAVQSDAIPPLLAGQDVVIEAPTGSGKTLAFVIPLVERLAGPAGGPPRALVVTPTRELASQVVSVIAQTDPALRVVLAIGGVGYGGQLAGLRGRPDVVVGCPGRLLDLIDRGVLSLVRVTYLVLDEGDEMLDQGFARDVERIIARCPSGEATPPRQTVLASATMPDWVQRLIDKHLRSPMRVRVIEECLPTLEHGLLPVPRDTKIDVLSQLLHRQRTTSIPQTIVFHRTKHGAKKLARDLTRLGHTAVELQGNLSQNARDRAIGSFRTGASSVLVATNVAARGLDVAGVGLVINYELPETPQWLTHRVGRTARNGAAGRALTFVSADDHVQWRKLRRLGAPALPAVDSALLLREGRWRLTPFREEAGSRAPTSPPAVESRRPRPSFSGRTGLRGSRRRAAPR